MVSGGGWRGAVVPLQNALVDNQQRAALMAAKEKRQRAQEVCGHHRSGRR